MGTFTTKLKLGGQAYGVTGGLDPRIETLTVGQIHVIETLPNNLDYPCYREEYMCSETGVGSGTVWEYGKNIYATKEEAERGVIAHQQQAYKQRAERDARVAEAAARARASDLATLQRLKQQYEPQALVDA